MIGLAWGGGDCYLVPDDHIKSTLHAPDQMTKMKTLGEMHHFEVRN